MVAFAWPNRCFGKMRSEEESISMLTMTEGRATRRRPWVARLGESARLRDELRDKGVVVLRSVLAPKLLELLTKVAERARPTARPRDLIMPGFETPRRMSTVGG